jgi:NodT family efflux transporter outer membrane factor (OMF) lipoprotein
MALCQNPTMQMACARVQAAEAGAKIQKSYLLPTIGFNADLNWQYYSKNDFFRAFAPQVPGNIAEYEINLDFSYELDFWGKNRNKFQAALGVAKALEAERQNAALVLSTSVAVTYFRLQAHWQKLAVLKRERAVLTKSFLLTEKRQENALDNSQQRLGSEEQLFVINKNILFVEQEASLFQNMLKQLVGEGPDVCLGIEQLEALEQFRFPLPCCISSNLLSRRPDLMAYIWRVQSGAHLVGAAKAEFYPRVDLLALGGVDSIFVKKLFSWQSRTGYLEPAVYLPIFNAGRLRANLREKQAEFEELIYSYNDAVLRAAREVSDGVISLQIVSEKLDVERQLVENRVENRKLEELRYKNALVSMLDLLAAQDAVLKQEFSRIQFEYERAEEAVKLIKALGGGYCTEEVPFDR